MQKKLKAAIVSGTAIAVVGGGVAFAFWTTSGSGTGSATTGTSHAVSVEQVGTITNLTPGGPAQAIDFKITNPDSTNQFNSGVTVSISSVNGGNDSTKPACTADDFALVQPTVSYGDLTPGAHTYSPSGATLALTNAGTNQDNCKGASVSLNFAAN